MGDIFDRCFDFPGSQRIGTDEDLKIASRLLFGQSPIDNAGPGIKLDGEEALQFSTNDYLGMSTHPEVLAAGRDWAERYGVGAPMGARPLTGTTELHLQLEKEIAQHKGAEAALIFSTGAGAMMGAIACLARPGDMLIFDQLAHASLVCGGKISGACIKSFRHNDTTSLQRVLESAPPDVNKMVVVDGVYSMNGDIAPLPEICDLCERYEARLFVDDAHGYGVCGKNGRGVAEMFDVEDRIDIQAGTFSKALGTCGGFVTGPKEVIFYIRCRAPTILFTKTAPACVVAATRKSLELVKHADDRREKLWSNTDHLQSSLQRRGFEIGITETPITPIKLPGNKALHIADILRDKYKIWVSPVVYPAVRRNAAIIRVIPTALHTREQIDYLIDSIETAAQNDTEESARKTIDQAPAAAGSAH